MASPLVLEMLLVLILIIITLISRHLGFEEAVSSGLSVDIYTWTMLIFSVSFQFYQMSRKRHVVSMNQTICGSLFHLSYLCNIIGGCDDISMFYLQWIVW